MVGQRREISVNPAVRERGELPQLKRPEGPSERTKNLSRLVLNILPVSFSRDCFTVGRLTFTSEHDYNALREQHWQTHAFRYDQRCEQILNVPIASGQDPLGDTEVVEIHDHLLLAAHAIQRAVVLWIAGKLPVVEDRRRVVFYGKADEALLLSQALSRTHEQPRPDLEVLLRYELDCRMFFSSNDQPYLGLVVDLQTANVIDTPLDELARRGLDLNGKYVSQRMETDRSYLQPRLELLGRITSCRGSTLTLIDGEGEFEVDSRRVVLEPRTENLHSVIETLYPNSSGRILAELRALRAPVTSATGKLERFNRTLKQ